MRDNNEQKLFIEIIEDENLHFKYYQTVTRNPGC